MKINSRTSAPSKTVSLPLAGVTLQRKAATGSSRVSSGGPLEDRIQISSEGTDFMAIMSAVSDVPDVREDLVSAIKRSLDQGKYHAPPEIVAEKIIRESLMNAALLL